VKSFDERCQRVLEGQNGFSAPIQSIINLARQHGAKVIFVEMPMPSRHRNTFYSSAAWQAMRTHLQKLAATQEVAFLSASDWVKDDQDFEDATHLNETGAKSFSSRLAAEISRIEPGIRNLASGR
jgi:lysophospholipase L1-like esterase